MPCLIRDKSGIFYIVHTIAGKRVWRSARTRNRKEAYQAYLLSTAKQAEPEETRLSDCTRDYLEYVKSTFAPKTFVVYRTTLRHFSEALGEAAVNTITSHEIDRYKTGRASTVSPATVNIEIRAIRAFFNTLKRWEIIERNPCDGVRYVKIPEQLPTYLGAEQLKSLANAIQDRWLRDIVVFAAMTGGRIGEILNLTWPDVNLGNMTLTFRSSGDYRVKGGKIRTIPMNETVYALVLEKQAAQRTREYVFPGKRGKKANQHFVSRKFKKCIDKLGFDRKLHFHSLRHTFASLLVTRGVSLYKVQKLMGHSSAQVTQVYSHLEGSEMHSVVGTISMAEG